MNTDSLRTTITELVAARLRVPPDTLDPDADLGALGLTSLDAVILTGEFEDRFDAEVDVSLLFENRTLSGLAAALCTLLDGAKAP